MAEFLRKLTTAIRDHFIDTISGILIASIITIGLSLFPAPSKQHDNILLINDILRALEYTDHVQSLCLLLSMSSAFILLVRKLIRNFIRSL